jgi:chromosome segregation and condensation protein ScpB
MNLEQKIEAILFFKGEPVSLKKIEDILKVSKEEIDEAILNLKNNLANRGIALIEKEK